MRRLMLAAILGSLALPGCIVAVERHDRHYQPPPPPPPSATVTVAWSDARVVFLREYYGCDWDDVGVFDFYHDRHGIPEDDLFVLFYIARHRSLNFHEVVFTYESCGRNIFQVTRRCGFPIWSLYVDLPRGTWCPPVYARCYGYYWNRNTSFVLSNYDCHALFWLRFSVNYYGWQPRECFTRWERCVNSGDRFTVVLHREYNFAGRGNHNAYGRPVVRIEERPERGEQYRRVIQTKRVEVVKKVEVDVDVRVKRGEQIVRPPPREEVHKRIEERRREHEQERERERAFEKKELERTKHERPKDDPKDDMKNDRRDDRKDERRDDRKDDRKDDREDDRKDDRKDPPPPKDDRKKDDRKDDRREPPPPKDERKKDDRKDDRKEPPPPKDERKKDDRKEPPPPPKDDRKKDDRKDDQKKDERKKDERKDDQKKEDQKKDDKKRDDKKQDNQKDGGGKRK